MAGNNLSKELIDAGLALLLETDKLAMGAQGAMWVFSPLTGDWRYYLVTSLVDSAGRRKAYQLLIEAFEKGKFRTSLTVEDVHLGSPKDQFFQLISGAFSIDGGVALFSNCMINGIAFDGVIYRSVIEVPAPAKAKQIQKAFERNVAERELKATA